MRLKKNLGITQVPKNTIAELFFASTTLSEGCGIGTRVQAPVSPPYIVPEVRSNRN
jgi:hypothetical protein